ncbi:unnamed protein product [Caenorhabditis brenneri]
MDPSFLPSPQLKLEVPPPKMMSWRHRQLLPFETPLHNFDSHSINRVTIRTKTGQHVIGLSIGKRPLAKPNAFYSIKNLLLECWKHDKFVTSQIEKEFRIEVLAVCMAAKNFEVGEICLNFQPFVPTQSKIHLTYQSVTSALQLVYYNRIYLAGLCYSLRKTSRIRRNPIEYHEFLITSAFLFAEPFPYRKMRVIREHETYGRWCSLAVKRVVVRIFEKKTYHVEFDDFTKDNEMVFCEECMEDYYTSDRMERGKKDPLPSDPITKSIQDRMPDGYLNFARSTLQQPITILVFNKTTGKLLELSKWPKPNDLIDFLESNPDCNVHLNSALVAKMVLGVEYSERIGGSSKAEETVEIVENLIDLQSARDLPICKLPTHYPNLELTCERLEKFGLSELNLDSSFTSNSTSNIPEFWSSSPSIFHDCNRDLDDNFEFVTDC